MEKLTQEQQLRLTQKLSPKQILFTRLLEIPSFMMEQRIEQELMDNPALDTVENDMDMENPEDLSCESDNYDLNEDSYNEEETNIRQDYADDMDEYFSDELDNDTLYRHISNYAPDDEVRESPLISRETFQESLKQQTGMFQFDEDDQNLAEYILGNIDSQGYLQRTAKEISNDLLFNNGVRVPTEKVQKIIDIMIHGLEPAGVGALDLKQCLQLQLERMEACPEVENAALILEKAFPEFIRKNYEKIGQKIRCNEEELQRALNILTHMDPKPGISNDDMERESSYISPDFIVNYNEKNGTFELSLPKYNIPDLCIRKAYKNMYEDIKKQKNLSQEERKNALNFIKQKVTSAEWFIESLSQRETTLFHTMECILDFQKTFFQTGDEATIKPMILKDIAEKIGINISTVSRITSSKYVLTPYGMYPLKFFFSESMEKDGEEVSSREIKKIIQDTINEEDKKHPLTDDGIQEVLEKKGYRIARRTVAKYREQLGFPTSRLRK